MQDKRVGFRAGSFFEKYYFRVDIDVGIVYIKCTNINNTHNIHSMDTNHYERRNI